MRHKVRALLRHIGEQIFLSLVDQILVTGCGTFAVITRNAVRYTVQPADNGARLPDIPDVSVKRNIYLLCNIQRRLLAVDQMARGIQNARVGRLIKGLKHSVVSGIGLQCTHQ